MRLIQKFTASYNENEDRLHLLASDVDGRVFGLWLTRRLADRLIPALLGRLEQSASVPGDLQANAALNAWEQSAARAQHQGSEPVRAACDAEQFLLHSIDLGYAPGEFRLAFRWTAKEDEGALLLCDVIAVRQWLNIVHHLYAKAEWPRNVWPAWFEEADEIGRAHV